MKQGMLIVIFISVLVFLLVPAQALAATLSLVPATGTFNRGCNFSLRIDLDTQGVDTDGTDAILLYDSTRFTALSVTSGTIYPDYITPNIDKSAGKISVSGISKVDQPVNGKGTFATLNFQVVDASGSGTVASSVKFDFDPNDKAKTTDSNVIERGTIAEVLSSVVDGNYTVGTGSCTASYATPRGNTGLGATASATPKPTLAGAGLSGPTLALTLVGIVFTIFGIAGLALL